MCQRIREVSFEKCICVKEILKVGFLDMNCESLLGIIDKEKLIDISGFNLNQLIENDVFSFGERMMIRKMRRTMINRRTAKKSGLKKKNRDKLFEDEILELLKLRKSLRIEKIELQKEINKMSVALINGHI